MSTRGGDRSDPPDHTGQDRHPDVHEDYVRREPRRELDGLLPVGGLAHHPQVVLCLDQRRERGPQQRLVIDDEHADRHGALSNGTWANTRNPPPGRGPAVSDPPNAPIRSRIPTIP